MPYYDLYAVDGGVSLHLETIDATDAEEAIVLSVIRLERREIELCSDGVVVARLSKDGTLNRVSSQPGEA